MPQGRTRARVNWPTGLYSSVIRGTRYYRYRDPISKREYGLGTDFEVARKAAVQRNAEIASQPLQTLSERIAGTPGINVSFGKAIDSFLEHLTTRKRGRGDKVRSLSKKTIDDYTSYCDRFRVGLKDEKSIAALTLPVVSGYLDEMIGTPRAYNMARGLLVQIWDIAISKGWAEVNIPEKTLKLDSSVARRRLLPGQFDAVLEVATPWLNAAFRFALYCDQRRTDIATLPREAWNGTTLTFLQEKTNHVISMTPGPLLKKAIEDCLAAGPVNVDAIIRQPGRREPVSPDMLTKGFQRIRDDLIEKRQKDWKVFKVGEKGLPSFHEIRSLGAFLADKAKLDAGDLAGHATEEMKKLYLEGHAKIFEAESL